MGDLSWRFNNREIKYVKEVLDSGFASGTSGTMNSRLEKEFAEKFGLEYAVTFTSGTTTLHAALSALGVGYGDEVILSPLTVIACMNAILYCNAIPVFADIDMETLLIDPADIKRKITSRTKAIMPIHLYGQVCNMTEIMAIAKEYSLGVVEDSAQNFLGTHNDQLGGTFGDVASWSFENSKHITTGDGGIVALNSKILAKKIRKFGSLGFRNASADSGLIRVSKDLFQNPNYKRHDSFGYNFRLPEVAAALGLAQMEKVDMFVQKREQIARMYQEVLVATNCYWLVPQKTPKRDRNSYYTFGVKFERDDIKWVDFRKKYIENGGDGIYAAWSLCYKEDLIPEVKRKLSMMGLDGRFNSENGICPIAEEIQPKLMQFTTNQKDEEEGKIQADALYKTIKYFS